MDRKTQDNTEERYFIKFNGKIDQDKSIDEVMSGLSALFKCDQKKINKLFDGKVHIIKKELDWNNVNKYQEILRQKGAVTDIGVMMDEHSLKSALFPVEKKISNPLHKNKYQEDDVLQFNFNRARIFPTFFYLPHSEPFFLNDSVAGTIESLRPSISWVITFLLTVPLGFFVEWHFSYLYSSYVTTSITSTFYSIALFGAILFYLPNLMRPKREVSVKSKFEEAEVAVKCLQRRRFQLVRKRFEVVDSYGGIIGEIRHDLITQHYVSLDSTGTIMLTAEEETDTSDIVIDAIKDIRDELLNLKILDLTKSIWGMIKSLGEMEVFHQTKKNMKKVDLFKFEGENTIVIRDREGAVVGQFLKNQNCPLILYRSRLNGMDKRMILAFYMLLSGL